MRQTDDRQTDIQTDRDTEKCVAIGGIACAARPIPSRKFLSVHVHVYT